MEGPIPFEFDNYDWASVFATIDGPRVVLGGNCSDAPFRREDVARVIGHADGENESLDWIAVLQLHDGRYAFISANCCCTGWDAAGGGYSEVAAEFSTLKRFGMGQAARRRLGMPLIEDYS